MVVRAFGRLIEPVPVLKAAGAALVIYLLLQVPSDYSLVVLPFACLAALGLYAVLVMGSGAVRQEQVVALFRRDRSPAVDETAPPPEEGI
jgi:predicted membrane-bound mannosyltransferase